VRGNGNGGSTALAARVQRLESELADEKRRRQLAEQKAAGLRSAVVRLQASLLKRKAEDAERRAESA
jgi:hypothetical protein